MLDFPSSPALGQTFQNSLGSTWAWDGTKWMPAQATLPTSVNSVPIAFSFSGKPLGGASIVVPIAMPLIIPANLAGSTTYIGGSLPTASAVFNLYCSTSSGGFGVGTITFPASGSVPTFAGNGGTIAAGYALSLTAPSTQDATLSNVGITILATRG